MSTPLHKQNELAQQRATIFESAKNIRVKAEAENRGLTAEEQTNWDKCMADMDGLKARMEREQKETALAAEMNTVVRAMPRPDAETSTSFTGSPEYRAAFDHLIRTGSTDKLVEMRAMSVGTTTAGGHTVPDDLLKVLIQYEAGVSAVVALAKTTTASRPFTIPRETSLVTVSGVAEVGSYLEVTPAFDQINFNAYKHGRLVKASEELVNDSLFDVLGEIVAPQLGKASGVEKGRFLLSGTGTSQPEGILTSCTEASTGADLTYAIITALMYSVHPEFRANGRFVTSNTGLQKIMSLLDNANRPLFIPAGGANGKDTILGKEVWEDVNMPANSSGNKVLLFGDFSTYWINQFTAPAVQTLLERYADTGEVGYRFTERYDAHPTNVRAIKWHRRTS